MDTKITLHCRNTNLLTIDLDSRLVLSYKPLGGKYTVAVGGKESAIDILINGTRRVELMEEDSVKLKFVLSYPLQLQIGDYIDTPYGTFYLTEIYRPNLNRKTGGFEYDVTFDSHYMRWKTKLFRMIPDNGPQETIFSLTAPLALSAEEYDPEKRSQFQVIIENNLKLWGYKYNDLDYEVHILGEAGTYEPLTTKTVSFDCSNIIDALTSIAQAWDAEWWVEGNIVYFGKMGVYSETDVESMSLPMCNGETAQCYVWEEGVNAAAIDGAESQGDYATRLWVYGGTQNLTQRYRRKAPFVIEEISDVTDIIGDWNVLQAKVNPPICREYFRQSKDDRKSAESIAEDYTAKVEFDYTTPALNYNDTYEIWSDYLLYNMVYFDLDCVRDYDIDVLLSKIGLNVYMKTPYATNPPIVTVKVYATASIFLEDEFICNKDAFIGESQEETLTVDGEVYGAPARYESETCSISQPLRIKLDRKYQYGKRVKVAVYIRCCFIVKATSLNLRNYKFSGYFHFQRNNDLVLYTANPQEYSPFASVSLRDYKYKEYLVEKPIQVDAILTDNDDEGGDWGGERKREYIKFYQKRNASSALRYIKPGTVFYLDNTLDLRIPLSYFTETTDGMVGYLMDSRLRLPQKREYIDINPKPDVDSVVESYVTFDDIYPQAETSVTKVNTVTRKRENEEGEEIEYKAYEIEYDRTHIGTIDRKSLLPNNEAIEIVFQTGRLAGMKFKVKVFSGEEECREEGHENPFLRIVPNEDYSRFLPDEYLYPMTAEEHKTAKDGFTENDRFDVINVDVDYLIEGMTEEAEYRLLQKAEQYKVELMEDPITYTVTLMPDFVFNITGKADKELQDFVFPLGTNVRLKSLAKLGFKFRDSRIIGYEFPLDEPYNNPRYQVGQNKKYSVIGELKQQVAGK